MIFISICQDWDSKSRTYQTVKVTYYLKSNVQYLNFHWVKKIHFIIFTSMKFDKWLWEELTALRNAAPKGTCLPTRHHTERCLSKGRKTDLQRQTTRFCFTHVCLILCTTILYHFYLILKLPYLLLVVVVFMKVGALRLESSHLFTTKSTPTSICTHCSHSSILLSKNNHFTCARVPPLLPVQGFHHWLPPSSALSSTSRYADTLDPDISLHNSTYNNL